MPILRSLRDALLAAALTGCAAGPPPVPTFALLPPASYGGSAHVTQTMSAAFGGSESTLQCFVDITPQEMRVLGLTATGERVFTFRYDGAKLDVQKAPYAPEAIAPERVLADLQLAFWPLPALQAGAPGWSISEPRDGTRRVSYGQRLVAETHRVGDGAWPAQLWLSNFVYGYALDIRSQERASP